MGPTYRTRARRTRRRRALAQPHRHGWHRRPRGRALKPSPRHPARRQRPVTEAPTFYEQVGGHETFERLVRRFYEGVAADPVLKPMYPDDDMEGAIWRLTAFLEQYWGGPGTYSEQRGHPRLRMRHNPFHINPDARDRWLGQDADRGHDDLELVRAEFLDCEECLVLPRDEDIADTIIRETTSFINNNKRKPFFLYVGTHDIHVPRVPHKRFVGKSGMGPRGDAILQLDAQVGAILKALDKNGLADNTIVVFTSDNGPVVDDGYQDQAVTLLGDHKPAGPLRGGKYSLFEGGTRVPFLVRWPKGQQSNLGDTRKTNAGSVSGAMISLVDMLASFDHLLGGGQTGQVSPDGLDVSDALRGMGTGKRNYIVEQAGRLALRWEKWKFIPAGKGQAYLPLTGTETGNLDADQLYDLDADPHEDRNVASANPDVLVKMKGMLAQLRAGKQP